MDEPLPDRVVVVDLEGGQIRVVARHARRVRSEQRPAVGLPERTRHRFVAQAVEARLIVGAKGLLVDHVRVVADEASPIEDAYFEIGRVESALDHAGVDAQNGEENGDQRDGRQFAHEFNADEDAQADYDQKEGAVDAEVVEGVRLDFDVADDRQLRTHVLQEDLDGADDVHGSGYCVAEVEQNADSASALGSERSRDHEVGPARWHDSVRGDRARRNGGEECTGAAHQDDEEGVD